MAETFSGLVVRVEGDPRTGKSRVWVNGQELTYWLKGVVAINVKPDEIPDVTLTFAPDRLWYETRKHDDESD